MRSLVVAVALIAACRGDHRKAQQHAGSAGSASAPLVPHIFASDDGVAALANVDRKIEILEKSADQPLQLVGLVLVRATFRGRLEDYVDADKRSAAWIASAPTEPEAWKARTQALTAIHEFTAAREALSHVKKLVTDDSEWLDLEVTIDEASGRRDRSMPARTEGARRFPNAKSLTLYAATLALQGKLDEALAQMPIAAAKLRDNSAETMAWLYFQWGRLYEQKGDYASARAFYQEAHARLPGYVEANAHLAQTMMLTGDKAGATQVVTAALASDRNPALLDLAAQLGIGSVDDARTAWERYLSALPKAFADHAARFYLGAGMDPKRALELARANLANRDVPEARELVVQAALASGDTTGACDAAGPLADAALRAHRFAAWQAFSRCGRTADAAWLAKDLGIAP
jgi:tetratricopeptide (TPR) repeat protein